MKNLELTSFMVFNLLQIIKVLLIKLYKLTEIEFIFIKLNQKINNKTYNG